MVLLGTYNMCFGLEIRIYGPRREKHVFGDLRTTKAQTSLRICADCSAPLLFAYWKVSYPNLLRAKFQFSSISVAERTDLSLALSETPKTGFLTLRPIL